MPDDTCTSVIDAVLRTQFHVSGRPHDSWRLSIDRLIGTATVANGWLHIRLAPRDHLWRHSAALARRNAFAPPGIKFVHTPRRQPLLIGELALADPANRDELATRVLDLCGGLLRTAKEDAPDLEAMATHATHATDAPDLTALCRDTGWHFDERDAASVSVSLATRRCTLHAVADHRADMLRARVEILAPDAGSAGTLQSLVSYLLIATSCVHLVRVACDPAHGTFIESTLAATATTAEVTRSFSALSVACDLFGPEAMLLRDDASMAAHYARCWDASCQQNPTPSGKESKS